LCCRGFTLIEVIIAIGIITLLSAVSTLVYGNYIDKARNIQAISEIRTMQNEIVVYEIDNDTLPDTLGELGLGNALDPWKTPYQYLKIANQEKKVKKREERGMEKILG
jgi:prepilin-type N-terminal cleavage/methylation domain-containing protein